MRNQNLKTPSLQSKSKKLTDSEESADASFSISNNNKSVPKEITTHQSRQPPLLSDAGTHGTVSPARSGDEGGGCYGRERLKRHWVEVAGRVWIPDIWGQEDLLKDWIDCSAFDSSLVGSSIMSARESLVEEGQRGLMRSYPCGHCPHEMMDGQDLAKHTISKKNCGSYICMDKS